MIYDIIRTMSKKERVKVTIDILKAVILALMTALFGIFGGNVMNVILACGAALFALIVLVGMSFYLIKTISA